MWSCSSNFVNGGNAFLIRVLTEEYVGTSSLEFNLTNVFSNLSAFNGTFLIMTLKQFLRTGHNVRIGFGLKI